MSKDLTPQRKEINRLLGKLKLSDVPPPKPMTKEEYDAMIKRWESGDHCKKEVVLNKEEAELLVKTGWKLGLNKELLK